jgi:hypothetical protein
MEEVNLERETTNSYYQLELEFISLETRRWEWREKAMQE